MSATQRAAFDVTALVAAASENLAMLLGEAATPPEPRTPVGAVLAGREANVLVSVTGSVRGQIMLGLDRATALGVAGTLLGMPAETIDEVVMSGIAELGNIVAAACSTCLEDRGLVATISVPTVLVGDGIAIGWPALPTWEAELETPFGSLRLLIGLRLE